MSAPVFLADREVLTSGSSLRLDGAEGHHAATVLRVRAGETVDVTDGRGLVVHAVVTAVQRGEVALSVLRRAEVPQPQPRVVVVQAVPKGDRGERAVELMTEIGVDEIVPWAAARCVATWRGDRAVRGLRRWRQASQASAKQARRWWHPEMGDLATTAGAAERVRGADLGVVLHESAGRPLSGLDVPDTGELVVVVGPEGGLTDDEVVTLETAGGIACHLGSTVLRTSTAGVAAAAALLSRTGRWASGPG